MTIKHIETRESKTTTWWFTSRHEMNEWLHESSLLPYPNHIVKTDTGKWIGNWQKVLTEWYVTLWSPIKGAQND